MSNEDLRTYLVAFFRTCLNSLTTESNFIKRVEILCNMYGVINENFDFLISDQWSNSDSVQNFLQTTYNKVLECRPMIYARFEVNFDINNPRTRETNYRSIYDTCLNAFSEFERKYIGDYFEQTLDEWSEDWNENEVEVVNDLEPY